MSEIQVIIELAESRVYLPSEFQQKLMLLRALDVLVDELAKITGRLDDMERALRYEPRAREEMEKDG